MDPVTSLDVLQKVDAFYSNAFTHLLVFISILGAFVGLVVPILWYFLQKRELRLQEAQLKTHMQAFIEDAKREIITNIEDRFEAGKKEFGELEERLQHNIDKYGGRAMGSVLHLQGNSDMQRQMYVAAVVSYLEATYHYIKAEDMSNLIRVLGTLADTVFPKLTKEDLDKELIQERFEPFLRTLGKLNDKGVFSDHIQNLGREFQAIYRRERLHETNPDDDRPNQTMQPTAGRPDAKPSNDSNTPKAS
jgi:hypothetical protein